MDNQQNRYISSFIVVKHSWKGRYTRVLSIGTNQLCTFDPKNLRPTNCWLYNEVVDVAPLLRDNPNNLPPTMTTGVSELFKLVVFKKKSNSTEVLKFSSDYRSDILCDLLQFRSKFASTSISKSVNQTRCRTVQYDCKKFHWSRHEIPICLQLTSNSINQIDTSGYYISSFYYKDIEQIGHIANLPGCFVIVTVGFGRLHMFRVMSKANQEQSANKQLLINTESTSTEQDSCKQDLITTLIDYAYNNCGVVINVKKDPIETEQFVLRKFGSRYSDDEAMTSLHEFTVYKISNRHQHRPVRRILCLTNSCLVERDPETYQAVTVKPLSEIFALIRSSEDPQLFMIEFSFRGLLLSYTTTERDSLMASLVDSVRAFGNIDVHVKMTPTNRGWRCGPLSMPVDDEIERCHLKAFQTLPLGWSFMDAVYRFNANCPYSGLTHTVPQDNKLFSENKAKLIELALMSFVDQSEGGCIAMDEGATSGPVKPSDIEQLFQAIRRLVASRAGFALFNQSDRFRSYLGRSIVQTIKLNNDAITHAGIDTLCALMQPMHSDCDIRHEQLNKSSLLASKPFLESLMEVLRLHINRGTGALVVASMLDFLTFALCAPYSETTESGCFDNLLNMVAIHGRDIFKLFQHPSLAIVKGAGLVIKAIIEEGEQNVSKRMQELALAEGALIKHLQIGLFSQCSDGRTLGVQFLSRHLVGLWSTGNEETQALFRRVFPLGLLNYLDSTEAPPQKMSGLTSRDNLKLATQSSMGQTNLVTNKLNAIRDIHPSVRLVERQIESAIVHWREQIGIPKRDEKMPVRPVVLRRRRERVKVATNWDMFYYQFFQDHSKPDLIWNLRTREELKNVIENELRLFKTDRELASNQALISWNYNEFEVHYQSLMDEVKIGDYFLRLLLEDSDNLMNKIQIRSPFHFLSDLYHRFLLSKRIDMRCICLQAMAIVYGSYLNEIGQFSDVRFIVSMLKDCQNRLERDRLLLLIEKLILQKDNAKDFIDANGVRVIVDMITLAHLHTQRAFVPTQTNVIEASSEMLAAAASKEWFYSDDEELGASEHPNDESESEINDKKRSHNGPYTFLEIEEYWKSGKINQTTKLWGQGMDGWRLVADIPQLKWKLLAVGDPVMNGSELAICMLNILIKLCEYYPSYDLDGAIIRPFPKVKKYLSDSTCLPHIVQLLLTFDPVIVERVATLMTMVSEENPILSQLYRSGIFFFILMYTGSNLIPIGRLLHLTHLTQAFRFEENSNQKPRSFLSYLLPEAMVCYLENYGPEKFAQIFLGEFDTPEAIWNGEMRRTMIERIACHVADFTCRLQSNNRATYEYCPIAPINYAQLENELFVNIYYLRNLCNTEKFSKWPIRNPVNLLKSLLDAWKEEADRKPSSFSIEDALRVLELDPTKYEHPEDLDENTIRVSYFKLAKKYHPDKNPEGRQKFEEINKSYEYLSSKQAREKAAGLNPKNMILIFKAQSILFGQCNDELHPYKYSGYPMLIKTIKSEIEDDRLFSKPDPLLAYACETAYYTFRCSNKNAEELRREGGLETLQQALSRCASVLSASSQPDDVCVQMCTHIVNCFTVAAEFEACQQKLGEMTGIIRDLNRILYFGKLLQLCLAASECLAAFASCAPLHEQIYQSGVLFSLMLFLFKYDYTLEEGGVDRNEGHNKQELTNQLAKTSLRACAQLNDNCPKLFKSPTESLLTVYLAKLMTVKDSEPHEILKTLNSNVEIPYLIWNNATRAELIDYLESQQREIIRSGECPDTSYGTDFVFSSHKDELFVGDVFIRVYNQQPSYPLVNASQFVQSLLNYIGTKAQYIHSALSLSGEKLANTSFKNVQDCLQALSLAIKFNAGIEAKCIGHFKLLFSLLKINQLPCVQDTALNVIQNITGNHDCVADVANSEVIVYLLMILYSSRSIHSNISPTASPTKQQSSQIQQQRSQIINNEPVNRTMIVLETLLPLMSNAKLVKEAIMKGGLVYLIDLFCNSTDSSTRIKSAELISRITYDRLSGFQACLILNRFLPMIFVDAMKDSTRDAVNLFDNNQENPELMWNSSIRDHVCKNTGHLAQEIYNLQMQDPAYSWQVPDDFNLIQSSNKDEIIVAGVYLRLFNQNPSWVLRKPKEFLTELMNRFQTLIKTPTFESSEMEVVSTALKNLLVAQPSLLDFIPAMGHIHSIISAIYSKSNRDENISTSCIAIISEMCSSRSCVDNMSSHDSLLTEIRGATTAYPDTIGIAVYGLKKMYDFASLNDRIVQQALESDFITFLLKLLESNQSAQTRALIVKTLKSMTTNYIYGQQVETILSKSKIWVDYSDQRHDLFISNEPSIAAIQGPSANVAGYLTGATRDGSGVGPAEPPPINEY